MKTLFQRLSPLELTLSCFIIMLLADKLPDVVFPVVFLPALTGFCVFGLKVQPR